MSEEIKQMQDDEREALISIYEGDEAFKQVNPTTYQYKVSVNLRFSYNIHFIVCNFNKFVVILVWNRWG